jgi:hypothetical protein
VRVHRALGDHEPGGDVLVRQPLGDQRGDLPFAGRQLLPGLRCRPGPEAGGTGGAAARRRGPGRQGDGLTERVADRLFGGHLAADHVLVGVPPRAERLPGQALGAGPFGVQGVQAIARLVHEAAPQVIRRALQPGGPDKAVRAVVIGGGGAGAAGRNGVVVGVVVVGRGAGGGEPGQALQVVRHRHQVPEPALEPDPLPQAGLRAAGVPGEPQRQALDPQRGPAHPLLARREIAQHLVAGRGRPLVRAAQHVRQPAQHRRDGLHGPRQRGADAQPGAGVAGLRPQARRRGALAPRAQEPAGQPQSPHPLRGRLRRGVEQPLEPARPLPQAAGRHPEPPASGGEVQPGEHPFRRHGLSLGTGRSAGRPAGWPAGRPA